MIAKHNDALLDNAVIVLPFTPSFRAVDPPAGGMARRNGANSNRRSGARHERQERADDDDCFERPGLFAKLLHFSDRYNGPLRRSHPRIVDERFPSGAVHLEGSPLLPRLDVIDGLLEPTIPFAQNQSSSIIHDRKRVSALSSPEIKCFCDSFLSNRTTRYPSRFFCTGAEGS